MAGGTTFMSNQGLSAGNAYAAPNAHYNVDIVTSSADHTHCDAIARGYGGYTSSPNSVSLGHYTYRNPTCSPGATSWSPRFAGYPGSTQYHGAENNPNISTFDNFVYAWVGWNCTYSDGWIC